MSFDRCDFRTCRECSCAPGECARPKPLPESVICFTWRDYAAVVAFGVIVTLIFAGTLHMMNQKEIQLKQEARI